MPRETIPTIPIDPTHVDEGTVLDILDRTAGALPTRKLVEIDDTFPEAVIVGDTHGDWPTVESLARKYLVSPGTLGKFVMLGDYVDRTPESLPFGSLVNAIYVLSLQARFPDRVVLLRGNHEARRRVALPESEIEEQSLQAWGSTRVSDRLEELFERLPLAAITESGAYLAHAGFPLSDTWRDAIERPTEATWLEVLWNDVRDSPTFGKRGIDQVPIDGKNLQHFLSLSGADVFIRGHDPWVVGKALFGNRLITVHSSRALERYGMFVALLSLRDRIGDLSRVELRRILPAPIPHPESGSRTFSPPDPRPR